MAYENDKHFHNAKREVDHAYWNSFLTLNGILISVFTTLSVLTEGSKLVIVLLVSTSIFSCWFVIKNFRVSKDSYDKLNSLNSKLIENMSKEEFDSFKSNSLDESTRLHKIINRNERIIVSLFFLQMFFVLLILFINFIR